MSKRILSILAKENLHCLPSEKTNLDKELFTEYRDSDEHPAESIFENPVPSKNRIKIEEIPNNVPPIFCYFLDGSRRTYKIADVILDKKRYLPIIAGQVGVSLVSRSEENGKIKPLRKYVKLENVIAFPDFPADDLSCFEEKINSESRIKFSVIKYSVKNDKDPVDLGVAAIMKLMQDLEVKVVSELSNDNMLQNDSMLVIDGPLRFKKMKGRQFDIVQFRNVIGLSKSFKPTFSIGRGRKQEDVGSFTSMLEFGERTPVFKTIDDERHIGMWYMRLRPRERMMNPLQGVIKLERYALEQSEIENGLETDIIDTISGFMLNERNVTPFKADNRWANHIYPIYLAEKYIKSCFMSDVHFLALF
ncbi:MAG: hypothetical protein AB9891_14670 [Anaerolineaceae bacterium]